MRQFAVWLAGWAPLVVALALAAGGGVGFWLGRWTESRRAYRDTMCMCRHGLNTHEPPDGVGAAAGVRGGRCRVSLASDELYDVWEKGQRIGKERRYTPCACLRFVGPEHFGPDHFMTSMRERLSRD